MFKKTLGRILVLALALSLVLTSSAFASSYTGSQGNQATFETLEEARVSGPAAVANLETNVGNTFKSHPVLDGYPEGTTYVYRSANLNGGRGAARLNTNIMVFAEQAFENKDAALAYLKGLGVIDIIDKAIGSVVLVTPADIKAGFTANDQKNYYKIQTAMFAQKASKKEGDAVVYYSDAEYFGGFGYYYVIGIDGGATFLNNYISGTVDYAGRIAGMLLIGGKMEDIRTVATLVPTYLVNASNDTIEKYKKANGTDAYMSEGGINTYFNQALPLRKVVTASVENPDAASIIKDAYYNMFIKAMRLPVYKTGLNSASTPYQGYGNDSAPYTLCERNALLGDVTADGIHMIRRSEDRFIDTKTLDGEYLRDWFEYLPDEVLNNTAPAGTVPLILGMHGMGDDPRGFVDEIGLLVLAGKERLAVVAPEHQAIFWTKQGDKFVEGIELEVMPKLVKYMLETYPALDPSRVYVAGYSMGGWATMKAVHAAPSLFAGAVCMAGMAFTPSAEQAAQFDKLDFPIMFTTSTNDLSVVYDAAAGGVGSSFQTSIPQLLAYNGLQAIDKFDFAAYPMAGFKADRILNVTLNGEYPNHRWYLNNNDGIPMVALSITEGPVHALYPEYAKILWDFAKHYSRNQETGAVEYNPYIQ